MITLEIDKKPDKDWNKRLISSIGGNIYQTKEFAVHLQRQGQKPLFIKFINEKGKIISNIDKHSGRKNIERSVKRGVTVEEITGKNIGDYVNLKNKMNEENQNLIKVEDMLDSWRLLKPIGYGGIIARLGEIVTGGLFFSSFNGLIIEGGVARSKEDYEMKLYSQDLIKWKIIEWGIENNMKYYDLAGYNPHPKTAKEEGIKRYKAKWGGVSKPYWFIKK